MASYTTRLATLIEQATQTKEGLSHAERIETGRKKLFDFDYPIFDEKYRKIFETNFIRTFYQREIGFETEGAFKFNLETWLLINMPYFNRLYESELIEFDPFINSSVDVTHTKKSDKKQNDNRDIESNSKTSGTASEDSSGKSDVATTNNVTEDNFERDISSDTPDSRLTITTNDGQGVIEYASGIKEETENNKTVGNGTEKATSSNTVDSSSSATASDTRNDKLVSTVNDLEDFVQHRQGKIGIQTYSEMLTKYRSTFMRIENDIIFKEMNQLFMLVY